MPIICGVLQSKLQAQTHLWVYQGVPTIQIHLWGPPIEITGSNTSVVCTRVCQSSVGSSNQIYRLKHICGVYQGVPTICGVLQSNLQAQTHLWGVPGFANHLWGTPIKITACTSSVGCARVCQSSWGAPIEITACTSSIGCARVCQSSIKITAIGIVCDAPEFLNFPSKYPFINPIGSLPSFTRLSHGTKNML